MVVLRNFRPKVIAITAIGIEADTVRPAFSARYTVAAPNMIPKMAPVTIDFTVNSGIEVSAATNGLNW
jgi:hypothetical protein